MIRIISISLFVFVLYGCTGTNIKISPDLYELKSTYMEPYGVIGLEEISSNNIYSPAGNMTGEFSSEIKQSGFTKALYYPLRTGDKVEITLKSKFEVVKDNNKGLLFIKSVLIGLSLFILEPVFWYHTDYVLNGDVIVFKDGKKLLSVKAKTDAVMSLKWLSLGEEDTLEQETLSKAKKSLFRQLLQSIHYQTE